MNKVLRVERHMYAPELNKIWLVDGTVVSAPNVRTVEEAEQFIKKEKKDDSK